MYLSVCSHRFPSIRMIPNTPFWQKYWDVLCHILGQCLKTVLFMHSAPWTRVIVVWKKSLQAGFYMTTIILSYWTWILKGIWVLNTLISRKKSTWTRHSCSLKLDEQLFSSLNNSLVVNTLDIDNFSAILKHFMSKAVSCVLVKA